MRRYGKTHCAAALFGASVLLAACQEDEMPPEGTAAAADEAVTLAYETHGYGDCPEGGLPTRGTPEGGTARTVFSCTVGEGDGKAAFKVAEMPTRPEAKKRAVEYSLSNFDVFAVDSEGNPFITNDEHADPSNPEPTSYRWADVPADGSLKFLVVGGDAVRDESTARPRWEGGRVTFRSSPTVADYAGGGVPEATREVLVDRTSGAVTGYVPCGRRVDLHFYHATTGIEFGMLPGNKGGYHLSNDLYEVAGLYVDEIYPEGECKMGDGPRGFPSFEWTPSGARHRDVDILRAAEMHCNIVPQNVSVTAKIRRKADGAVTDVHIPLGKTKPGCSYVFGFERAFNN